LFIDYDCLSGRLPAWLDFDHRGGWKQGGKKRPTKLAVPTPYLKLLRRT